MEICITAADMPTKSAKDLGFEFDLLFSYKLIDFVDAQVGDSQFRITKGPEILKKNFDRNTKNWDWAMVTVDPVLKKNRNRKNQTIN